MKKLLWGLLPCLFFTAACEDDIINNISSSIVIEPVERSSATGSIDAEKKLVNIGVTPLYSGATAAFRVTNPSSKVLTINDVTKKTAHGTARYEVSFPKTVDISIAAENEQFIYIKYIPKEEWFDANGNGVVDEAELESAVFVVDSDAANGPQEIKVTGYGVLMDYPEFQVCFDSYCGPKENECYTEVGADKNAESSPVIVCKTPPLDFGNIGLGEVGSRFITMKNISDCTLPEGTELCQQEDLCKVIINKNDGRENIGFGIKAETNSFKRFEVQGSTSLPPEGVMLVQNSFKSNCGGALSSDIPMRINYNAPLSVSQDEAMLVIESSAPLQPIVYVPLKATAKDAPVARCAFRAGEGYPTRDNVAPLDRVYLDGTNSFDPHAKEDAINKGISRYEWRITKYPDGTNINDFSPNPATQMGPFFDFYLPLAGKYEVALTVYDSDNTASGETEDSTCIFEVKPASKLHVQLVWDHLTNDQDLHLQYLEKSTVFCDKSADCYWKNKAPVWFSNEEAGVGPNPRLDRDDTFGMGPENINIDTPAPGRYRVLVHYYSAAGNSDSSGGSQSPAALPAELSAVTRNTVRIYINGLIRGEYHRIMTSLRDLWAVADIVWGADGTVEVVPLDGDTPEETGWLCPGISCSDNRSCEAP